MSYGHKTVYRTNENIYLRMEGNAPSPHHRRCIDGKITGCGKCVGYCRYSEHPGYLTSKHRNEHDCIRKKCFYYVPKKKETDTVFNTLSEALALVM